MDHLQDLTKLGIKYMTDKAYFHSFTEFYNNYFYQFQKLDNINILEIGIGEGGSLRMLNEFFPNANIYAIDINTNYVNTYYSDRIKTFECDENDFIRFNSLFSNIKFDFPEINNISLGFFQFDINISYISSGDLAIKISDSLFKLLLRFPSVHAFGNIDLSL